MLDDNLVKKNNQQTQYLVFPANGVENNSIEITSEIFF